MTKDEPIKITLEDLEEPATPAEDPPATAKVRAQAGQAGRKVAESARESAGRLTQKITDSAADVAGRSADVVRDKMSEAIQAQTKATADAVEARIREIDWKSEAQKGAEGGLRWLSERLSTLADQMKAEGEKTPPGDPPHEEKAAQEE